MEITIQSVNFETSERLNEYITKKLGKLNRFSEIRVAEVQLKILNITEKSNREAGIKLHVGDELFYACKNAEKFEDAAAQSIEALERQIIKAKEKRH
jgi:ribosomal subunit interface protein